MGMPPIQELQKVHATLHERARELEAKNEELSRLRVMVWNQRLTLAQQTGEVETLPAERDLLLELLTEAESRRTRRR